MFRTEHDLKIFTDSSNLKNIFAKYYTTRALHFLCTATFFPDGISVQVQPKKIDLTALSKTYLVFKEWQIKSSKEGKKLTKKKKNPFACSEEIVKDLLWPKFDFILMTATQHISFFTARKYIQVTRNTLQTKNENTSTKKINFMRQLIATHISTQFVTHPQPDSRTLPTADAQHGSFLP